MRRRNNYGISSTRQMNVQPCLPTEEERQTIFTGLEDKQLRFFKISYLILYLLTYFYSAVFLIIKRHPFSLLQSVLYC